MEINDKAKQTDLNSFEAELASIIQEVEENKKKLEFLKNENDQLRLKNTTLEENERRYVNTLKQKETQLQQLEKQPPMGLSEKDLVEVMLDAKRVANDIVKKAQDEVVLVERQKKEALAALKQEGQLVREDIEKYRIKVNQDLNQWIESLERVMDSPE
ncbi:hypothetical protein [Lactococcus formosensis]|uniref:Uncharacterized protein n=1 Tax=Lactococcus formosensis TaxID=1281486 RepID=A0A9X4SFS7_9LACT|nr:hypothetical protein [Lactococcus formosensis]MCO7180524.1 hypothetical protein [Lactococcus formosensis]MDG6112561.1 hypothetical protein [Lactococcus formosensis]MDG6113456.1 hypothetical protein [Lactococcus formosensis]MDG6115690.1 hypothetical protein [Lactococcus formosensis]MDG6118805.1 hypothetical protein [Lactococcus formosensis]